jgi:hypothetical protein
MMDKDLPPCDLIIPSVDLCLTDRPPPVGPIRAPQACLSLLPFRSPLHIFVGIFVLVRNVS